MSGTVLAEWMPPAEDAADTRGVPVVNGFLRARVRPNRHVGASSRRRAQDRAPVTWTHLLVGETLPDRADGDARGDRPTDVLPVRGSSDDDCPPASIAHDHPGVDEVVSDHAPADPGDHEPVSLAIDVELDVAASMVGADGAFEPGVASGRRMRRAMLLQFLAAQASGVAVQWTVREPRTAEAVQALIDDGLFGDQITVTPAPAT